MFRENCQLSKNFSLYELTRTDYDVHQRTNRTLTDREVEKLTALASCVLQPIREYFRLPMIIHSGYRGRPLNEAVGGALTSQHCLAEAVDFHVRGLDDLEGSTAVFNWIYQKSDIVFGQLIHELRQREKRETIWLHISLGFPLRAKNESGQVLTYRKYGSAPGIYRALRPFKPY